MNYLLKLIQGDVRLVITFWVWYTALSFVLSLIFGILAQALPDFFSLIFAVIFIFYLLFITIAVWRSATKYPGKYIWVLLAKTLVAFGWARVILSLFYPDIF